MTTLQRKTELLDAIVVLLAAAKRAMSCRDTMPAPIVAEIGRAIALAEGRRVFGVAPSSGGKFDVLAHRAGSSEIIARFTDKQDAAAAVAALEKAECCP